VQLTTCSGTVCFQNCQVRSDNWGLPSLRHVTTRFFWVCWLRLLVSSHSQDLVHGIILDFKCKYMRLIFSLLIFFPFSVITFKVHAWFQRPQEAASARVLPVSYSLLNSFNALSPLSFLNLADINQTQSSLTHRPSSTSNVTATRQARIGRHDHRTWHHRLCKGIMSFCCQRVL